MKKILSVFLSLMLVLSSIGSLAVSSYAVTYKKGDITRNTKIDMADVRYMLSGIAVGRQFTAEEIESGDVTGDGKITIADAKLTFRMVGKKFNVGDKDPFSDDGYMEIDDDGNAVIDFT